MPTATHRTAAARLLLCALPFAAALVLLARGVPDASGTTSTRVHLAADASGALSFTPHRATVRRGTITLVMRNPASSGKPHGIAIEGKGVDRDGKVVAPGRTSTVTVRLRPGRYEFYCPIASHKRAGMEGTLTVR